MYVNTRKLLLTASGLLLAVAVSRCNDDDDASEDDGHGDMVDDDPDRIIANVDRWKDAIDSTL